MTRDEARTFLKAITRALQSNQGYTEQLSDLEIEGWLAFFEAVGIIKP